MFQTTTTKRGQEHPMDDARALQLGEVAVPHRTPAELRGHADSRYMQVTTATTNRVVIGSQNTKARMEITRYTDSEFPKIRFKVETHLEWPGIGVSRGERLFTEMELINAFRIGGGPLDRDTWMMAQSPGKFRRVQELLRIPGDTPHFQPGGESDGSASIDITLTNEIMEAVGTFVCAVSD